MQNTWYEPPNDVTENQAGMHFFLRYEVLKLFYLLCTFPCYLQQIWAYDVAHAVDGLCKEERLLKRYAGILQHFQHLLEIEKMMSNGF